MNERSTPVAIVESWLEALPEDIRVVYEDDQVRARLTTLLTPHLAEDFHIVLVGPEGSGFEERHEGFDGFLSGWDRWSEPYETYPFVAEDISEHGNVVLVDGRQTPTPIGAREPIEMNIASLWFFEEDRLLRAEFHLDRERAHRIAREHANP